MDGIKKPDMTITEEEFEAVGGLVRLIDGKIFLGKTDSIDGLFPDTRSKNQKKKDRKEYFKRKRKMRGSFTIEVKTKGLRLEGNCISRGGKRK